MSSQDFNEGKRPSLPDPAICRVNHHWDQDYDCLVDDPIFCPHVLRSGFGYFCRSSEREKMACGVAEVLRNTPKPQIKFAKSGNPARLLTSRKKGGGGDALSQRVREKPAMITSISPRRNRCLTISRSIWTRRLVCGSTYCPPTSPLARIYADKHVGICIPQEIPDFFHRVEKTGENDCLLDSACPIVTAAADHTEEFLHF